MNIIDIIEAISNIDEDILMSDGDGKFLLELKTHSDEHYIYFMGICIWDSVDDPRKKIDIDKYEIFETFLRHKIQSIIYKLTLFRL